MNVQLRMPRLLCDTMRRDLMRRHPFAAERIGFARAAVGKAEDTTLLLLKSYWAVPDAQYVKDQFVGARINSAAIRNAMQDVLDADHALFHVHLHHQCGPTGLSRTDQAEIPRLVESFRSARPTSPHGLIVLTFDHCLAVVWQPGASVPVKVGKIVVVGYPMELLI